VDLLKKYKEEIGEDLVVTDYNIKDIQLKLPSRKHFWAARLIDAKIEVYNLHTRKKKLKKAFVQKIITEAPIKLTQQSAEIAAESTDEISTINNSIKEYEFIVEYLEKVEKIMQNMHWEIKNIIDIQRMEQL
jgi:DNA-dependent RNA polymerase auxiliary subunit epsilon